MRRLILTLTIAASALAAASPAAAQVTVAGTGEPAFTNTTTNTQWFHWSASGYHAYQVRYSYLDNGVDRGGATLDVGGTSSGDTWANWQGVVAPLLEGHTYGICAAGYGKFDGIWFPDGANSCSTAVSLGKRASTTIDRSKPAITVAIDDGAAYSRDTNLDYDIGYSDNLAFPFPANFLCVGFGAADCGATPLQYDSGCSSPANPSSKNTSFACSDDVGAGAPDGLVSVCVKSADAAVPDVPGSSNQSGSAAQANLSNTVCDSITLDRTAPALAASATATAVTAGQPVGLTAQASDATSGLSGTYTWSFGDGTTGSGPAVNHAWSVPGTYSATVTTTDNAGNTSVASVAISVAPAPAAETGGTGGDTGGGSAGAPAPAPAPAAESPAAAPGALAALEAPAPQ